MQVLSRRTSAVFLPLQGGAPLQPPFEAVGEDREPSDQHLAVLQARIAAGEAPALTRRGVAQAADLLERAKAWAWWVLSLTHMQNTALMTTFTSMMCLTHVSEFVQGHHCRMECRCCP